jgi:hypothetical protein
MSLEEIKVLLINGYNMPVGKKVKMKWKVVLYSYFFFIIKLIDTYIYINKNG